MAEILGRSWACDACLVLGGEMENNEVAFVDRLREIKVVAYGKRSTVLHLLMSMTDEEVEEVFSGVLESMLQEGRAGCSCDNCNY